MKTAYEYLKLITNVTAKKNEMDTLDALTHIKLLNLNIPLKINLNKV
jgi:hypothetical protein